MTRDELIEGLAAMMWSDQARAIGVPWDAADAEWQGHFRERARALLPLFVAFVAEWLETYGQHTDAARARDGKVMAEDWREEMTGPSQERGRRGEG